MYDNNFLQLLDQDRNRVVYAKVTKLTFDERPQQEIDGRVTTGSINIDGASSSRRSFSLSLIVDDSNINLSNYYWGIDTKIKLAIGLENHIDDRYPKIIWFEQGVFVINSLSQSYSGNNCTLNIGGKDKMCLLDGSVSGKLTSAVDFGKWEQEEKYGGYKYFKKPIKDIIREAVHEFAKEPYQNIVINDLPDYGLILQEYRYDKPLYLWRLADNNSKYLSGTIDDTAPVEYNNKNYKLGTLPTDFIYDPMNLAFAQDITPSEVKFSKSKKPCYLVKIDCGETAGYMQTKLVYPEDLIEKAGSNIVSVLNKLVGCLGDYEYFYDVDGRFIFQKRKTYLTQPWTPFQERSYEISAPTESQYSYKFNDSSLFTSFSLTPNFMNVKNDFTVWGQKNLSDGDTSPIHMRIAIDKRPVIYHTISITDEELIPYNEKYGLSVKGQTSQTYIAKESEVDNVAYSINNDTISFLNMQYNYKEDYSIKTGALIEYQEAQKNIVFKQLFNYLEYETFELCDWRELIYQMAKDYKKYNHLDDFFQRVAAANPIFKDGITGYEQYYTDLDGFWRNLYMPIDVNECLSVITSTTEEALNDDINYWQQVINTNTNEEVIKDAEEQIKMLENKLKFFEDNKDFFHFTENGTIITDERLFCWNRAIFENPSRLNFWFDFLNPDNNDLAKFSVPVLGSRQIVEEDSNVNAIAYLDTPEIILGEPENEAELPTGYIKLQLGNFENMFAKSSQGIGAREKIDQLLYQYTYFSESVSVNAIPIYYLQPNTRVYINDKESGVIGDYIVDKIGLSLTYNGTMSLTLTKAPPIIK